MTNVLNWRLKVDRGRQTWHYLEYEQERLEWPQTVIDKYWLGILKDDSKLPKPKSALDAARNGLLFYQQLQTEDGHFAGEYGGPMFLIPGLVITMYITQTPFPPGYKQELIRYLRSRAHPKDGGWGIHIESHSTVFGTSLNYVALRLLGVSADDPCCVKARNTLWKLGGALGNPSWGKFWLSVLNVYDWDGNNSIPPELWILPEALPIHPSRLWCHTRMVYLGMCYLYGIRFQAPLDDLILSLRDELYPFPYDEIKWSEHRDTISEADVYYPTTPLMNGLNQILAVYEKLPNSWIRKKALDAALDQIRYEDENTDFLDIGPVNKVMNMLVVWIVDGPESDTFRKHCDRIPDFMWMSSDGMRMNGTNGSQLWDTSFAILAIMEGNLAKEKEFEPMILKTLEFFDDCQLQYNHPKWKEGYRHPTKGAWPFSTRHQGYTVSDCTAEGLKSVLCIQHSSACKKPLVSYERLCDAVDILLSMQNENGGFADYELIRGPAWLELLNPAQVFGNIMIGYCYPECTTSSLLGLRKFQQYHPEYRREEVEQAVRKAVDYIYSSQREDGSWYGSWGICFTYAMFFALESLSTIGESYHTSPQIQKACQFLVERQMKDGGWGESYKSCETHTYCHHEKSQVVQTSWALLALMAAQYPDQKVIKKGIDLIMSRQQRNGEWLQEAIEGVFNHNCMISYPNYKFAFTIWCLSRYNRIYE